MVSELKGIQKVAEAMQGFKNDLSLLVSFLPVLEEVTTLLKAENKQLIDNNIGFDESEIAQLEYLAKIFHIIAYDCINNKPTHKTILLAQACFELENIYLTITQHSKALLDTSQGHFYASEQNLQELVDASMKMLDEHDIKQPVEFIQVA
ncbi:MAG: hypothetical protein JJV99_02255 [Colwellia sp.]|nr:hypothetical protein [Colwellia sp.]